MLILKSPNILNTVIIAIAIKIFDEGNIIYTQKRVGYKGREFKILKFRIK